MMRILAPAAALALLAASAPAGLAGEGEEPEDRAGLARKVLEGFAGFDADADGKIAAAEFPLEDLFGELDADRDGFLTKEEIARVLKSMKPAGGMPGPKKERGPAPKPKAPPMDGETFLEWAKGRVAVDPRFNPETRRAQFLQGFDRDPKDGKIQKKEYAAGDADRVFREFDADNNGALDERELLAMMKDQVRDLAKQRRHPNRYNFLVLFDLDDDTNVTRDEYAFLRGPATAFQGLDDDGDGVVTYNEIVYDQERTKGKYRGRNGSGEEAATNRTLWDLYDKDQDGRVTPEEFGGGEAVFRRLDRNRDGYLTLADA